MLGIPIADLPHFTPTWFIQEWLPHVSLLRDSSTMSTFTSGMLSILGRAGAMLWVRALKLAVSLVAVTEFNSLYVAMKHIALPDQIICMQNRLHCSKRDKYCASCDCCRPLSAVVLLRHVAARISLCVIILLGSPRLKDARWISTQQLASYRRIGPRALRWLRRVVPCLHLRRKARVFAVYARAKCCFRLDPGSSCDIISHRMDA